MEERHLPYSMASPEERQRRSQWERKEAARVAKLTDEMNMPAALAALERINRLEARKANKIVVSLHAPLPCAGSQTRVRTAKEIEREYTQRVNERRTANIEAAAELVTLLGMNPYQKRRRRRSGFGISIPLPGPFRWGKRL